MIDLKLRESKDSLSTKEKQVAEYIVANKKHIQSVSIQSLAQENNVSTTTILRLCHKLGYQGFSELKIDLISSISSQPYDEFLQEDININDSIETVNHKVSMIEKSSIDETCALVNLNSFKQANELISKSQKIVIYGAGSSGLVAKELEYQLIKIKKDVNCHLDYSIQFSIVNTLNENDLVIVISHSGENHECIKLLTLARELNVPTIAITKMGQSSVSNLAETILHTISTENVSRIIPIRSKISQLTIINMLITNLFIKQYDERISKQISTRAERFSRLNSNN
ncbi:RpiR family transcriptional regulator [Providencia burhodogranariea DSM 19968]|uniref:RpiR family transcriptional regulator n=2 Tax=Providencia burhodogranariea TaxID=516074 RepID=K8WWY8_9GAMM|nr:RpiR family transcriptional regulator [Providencia burhodogranariea DSM 19968]